ncbi:MAG: SIS domain-containing protein [Candidatus Limiplasma sp.]|nr:SIS domain-containing protein [Candidatus Limiplasma sp.]
MDALKTFLEAARQEVRHTIDAMEEAELKQAAELIWAAEANRNRVHVTGIGKPGHVANYLASLLSSTGTPSYFLHGTEAVHGSCGQLVAGDVVICISNSGETVEMKATAAAIRNNGCKIIAVTGNPKSWLATFADAHLTAGVSNEGGPLNRAPRTSILAEILVLQGLSVVLQEKRNLTPAEYVLRHPGGALGQIREGEA